MCRWRFLFLKWKDYYLCWFLCLRLFCFISGNSFHFTRWAVWFDLNKDDASIATIFSVHLGQWHFHSSASAHVKHWGFPSLPGTHPKNGRHQIWEAHHLGGVLIFFPDTNSINHISCSQLHVLTAQVAGFVYQLKTQNVLMFKSILESYVCLTSSAVSFGSMAGTLGWIWWACFARCSRADAAAVHLPLPRRSIWCHHQICIMWWSFQHLLDRYTASYCPELSMNTQ